MKCIHLPAHRASAGHPCSEQRQGPSAGQRTSVQHRVLFHPPGRLCVQVTNAFMALGAGYSNAVQVTYTVDSKSQVRSRSEAPPLLCSIPYCCRRSTRMPGSSPCRASPPVLLDASRTSQPRPGRMAAHACSTTQIRLQECPTAWGFPCWAMHSTLELLIAPPDLALAQSS